MPSVFSHPLPFPVAFVKYYEKGSTVMGADQVARRGHKLVLDVQDTVVFKQHIKNKWLYGTLISKSGRQLADFGRKGKLGRVI